VIPPEPTGKTDSSVTATEKRGKKKTKYKGPPFKGVKRGKGKDSAVDEYDLYQMNHVM